MSEKGKDVIGGILDADNVVVGLLTAAIAIALALYALLG